jgi:hypothetical protein
MPLLNFARSGLAIRLHRLEISYLAGSGKLQMAITRKPWHVNTYFLKSKMPLTGQITEQQPVLFVQLLFPE